MSARRFRLLRHRIRRLSQVRWHEHRLLAEATLALLGARLALATVPFPRLARRMGGFVAPQQACGAAAAPPAKATDEAIAREIGWAVTRAARHLPFSAVCLPQALAARAMLRKRHVSCIIHFGTARGAALGLDAHAWVDVGAVEVTGYPVGHQFTEIACLAA